MSYKRSILIVDDEPRSREGMKRILDAWADGTIEILSAEDGTSALELLAEREIHLVITDIRMPEMNGLHMVRELKDTLQHQPVVMICSGYSEFDYAQEAITLGIVNYLLKPVKKQKLIEAVEQALEVEERRRRAGLMEKIVDEKLIPTRQEGQPGLPSSPVQEAIDYVEKHIHLPLSLREVADHVHLNASYFSVLFKEKTGLTYSEYVTRSRLQAAKRLLISTPHSVNDIAEQVGYRTAKYFITLFKTREGITPSQYRKQNQAL